MSSHDERIGICTEIEALEKILEKHRNQKLRIIMLLLRTSIEMKKEKDLHEFLFANAEVKLSVNTNTKTKTDLEYGSDWEDITKNYVLSELEQVKNEALEKNQDDIYKLLSLVQSGIKDGEDKTLHWLMCSFMDNICKQEK